MNIIETKTGKLLVMKKAILSSAFFIAQFFRMSSLFFLIFSALIILFSINVIANGSSSNDQRRADFEGCIADKGPLPVWVKFTDRSTGEPVAWEWDFGDGGHSYEQNPYYPYYAEGCCYTVGLTVEFQDGKKETVTKEDCVCIGECPPKIIIEPAAQEVDALAGAVYFTVSNNGGTGDMDWFATITTGNLWMNISSGDKGTNTGVIEVLYSGNPSFVRSREGKLTVVSDDAINKSAEALLKQLPRTGGETALTCSLSSSSVVIGEPVTIYGSVATAKGTPVAGAPVEAMVISSDGSILKESELTTSDGYYDIEITPNHAGSWAVQVFWQGDEHYEGDKCKQQNLVVNKAGTKLSLTLSSQSIKMGDSITVSGSLGTIPYNPWQKSGMTVLLNLTKPNGINLEPQATFTNAFGQYSFSGINVFDEYGKWIVKAEFQGTENYRQTSSQEEMLTVLSRLQTGYAILVQGCIESKEGIDTHKKTIETIYRILQERNIMPENIKVLGYNLSSDINYEMPTKTGIEKAVKEWAYERMHALSAPLYIIMVGHGNAEKFYIYPEVIFPYDDLNVWVEELESRLAPYDFEKNPFFVFIGSCASGSFIHSLSKPGRVIITSAAENESASRGPVEDDGTRQGSYFLSEFFKAAGRGQSIKESFEDATRIIENWTEDKSERNAAQSSPYHDSALQHPLIDDNGDTTGSNRTSPVSGKDGAFVRYKYLGATSLRKHLEIVRVTPQISLAPEESLPRVWIELNDASLIESLWLEIRPPDFSYPDVELAEQLEIEDVFRVPFNRENCEGNTYYFEDFGGCNFSKPGTYEIFYFAKDSISKEILPLQKTVVNRDKTDNNSPASFSLVAPADKSRLNYSPVLFTWEPSEDPDGDIVTYSLFISENKSFNNTVIVVNEIATNAFVLDIGSDLKDGKTYYWKVEAVDRLGAITSSNEIWSFDKDFSNIVLGTLEGYVYDDETGKPLNEVAISSNCGSNYCCTDDNGIFFLVCPEGSYQGEARRSGYHNERFSFTIADGETTPADDIPMKKSSNNVTTTTTIPQEFQCPLEKVYGKDAREIPILREFRDEILHKIPEGREIIELYYENSPAIIKAMDKNREYKERVKLTVEKLLPIIESLLYEGKVHISPKKIEQITLLFNQFCDKNSAHIKAILKKGKEEINKKEVLNKLGIIIGR